MSVNTETEILEIDPPVKSVPAGRDRWTSRLESARRRKGRWVMLTQPMAESTAAQIASDIRCSHKRPAHKQRIRAIRSGEQWETSFGPHPLNPVAGQFHVWLRWMGEEECAW